jgi:hypothetical protein
MHVCGDSDITNNVANRPDNVTRLERTVYSAVTERCKKRETLYAGSYKIVGLFFHTTCDHGNRGSSIASNENVSLVRVKTTGPTPWQGDTTAVLT